MKEVKKTASFSVPPVAGYAAYKLWKAYNNGSLHFNFSNNEDIMKEYDVENQGSFLGSRPAQTIHGQEEADVPFDPEVYQFYPDTCAIQSQHIVLKQFGIDVTQNEMIEVAKENGWYVSGHGTPPEYVGKILEHYGVNVEATEGNNIFNLVNELAQGHQVIVGVDSGELVFPENEIDEDCMVGEIADHALVVVGVDTSDPNNVKVIVTDPGTGNRQWAYTEEQFMDAWKDSNCMMVSTEQSPEEFCGGNFDKLDVFARIPTSTIEQMADVDLTASYDFMDALIDSMQTNPEGWTNVIDDYPNIFHFDDDGSFHIIDPATGQDLTITEDGMLMV